MLLNPNAADVSPAVCLRFFPNPFPTLTITGGQERFASQENCDRGFSMLVQTRMDSGFFVLAIC